MRYLNILFLSLLVCFSQYSCKKEHEISIPVEVSFADPDSVLLYYQQEIEKQEYGWEFSWSSKTNGFYAGYLDFKTKQSSNFLIDVFPDPTNLISRLKIEDKKPCLNLETQALPSAMKELFGNLDTSFTILNKRGDTLLLRGNRYADEMQLVPITKDVQQAYLNGAVKKQIETISSLEKLPKYFKRLKYNGGSYDLLFNRKWRKLYINFGLVERYKFFESSFAYTATGIRLQTRFNEDVNSFSSIDIQLTAGTNELKAKINGYDVPFTNETGPSAYDFTAPRNFITKSFHQLNLNTGNNSSLLMPYSASLKGFTVEGKEDAYGITQVAGYGYLMLFPNWLNQDYGTLRIFLPPSTIADYGPATFTLFSQDGGLIGFQKIGEFGQTPAENKVHWDPTVTAFIDPYGFYVIKSGPASYDLVSVNPNEQKWIRFE